MRSWERTRSGGSSATLRWAEAALMPHVTAAAGIAGSGEPPLVGEMREPAGAGRFEGLPLLGERRVALQALGGRRGILIEDLRDETRRKGVRVPRDPPLRENFGVATPAIRGFKRPLDRRPLRRRLALRRERLPPIGVEVEFWLVSRMCIDGRAAEQRRDGDQPLRPG